MSSREEVLPEEAAYSRSQRRHPAARDLPEEVVEQPPYEDEEEEDYDGGQQQQRREEEDEREVPRAASAEEAALDLAELEQLHAEAERMKGLGNRHMANQEYTRAYNAYSAALQLSPVGPSSHVYLSNRAAALLSLKRYRAAATDARRAVALAPSFGKAHARLGQALYFLREYGSAVAAYEEAVRHEPDNTVTWTYLAKAQSKLAREEERRRRKERGEEVSLHTAGTGGTTPTAAEYSLATDPDGGAALVSGDKDKDLRASSAVMRAAVGEEFRHGNRGEVGGGGGGGAALGGEPKRPQDAPEPSSGAVAALEEAAAASAASSSPPLEVRTGVMGPGGAQAKTPPPPASTAAASPFPPPESAASTTSPLSPASSEPSPRRLAEFRNQDAPVPDDDDQEVEDADFDEALRLQSRADRFLSAKQYRSSVEEYSAALFLVPDDLGLSPALHLGRAHALNGLKRHESAVNDARMALMLDPRNSEAYSVLGKSLFYAGDFEGAVEALERSAECLGPGGEGVLGEFDAAYLEKAREALEEEERREALADANGRSNGEGRRSRRGRGAVPKLKPPRFVSREEILKTQPVSNRPMPKSWPRQSVRSPKSFSVGPERDVLFLSESMGIKLNRGPDGIIRVLSVSPLSPNFPVVRKGTVEAGDVVREAHGVDLRRPITNVMWGDTVALIKLAPRPVKLVLAKELSPAPPAVVEEMAKASSASGAGVGVGVSISPRAEAADDGAGQSGREAPLSPPRYGTRGLSAIAPRAPSPASGEEPVAASAAASDRDSPRDEGGDAGGHRRRSEGALSASADDESNNPFAADDDDGGACEPGAESESEDEEGGGASSPPQSRGSEEELDDDDDEPWVAPPDSFHEGTSSEDEEEEEDEGGAGASPADSASGEPSWAVAADEDDEEGGPPAPSSSPDTPSRGEAPSAKVMRQSSKQDREVEDVGGEVLFDRFGSARHGWTSEKWQSASSTRTLRHTGSVTRLMKGRFFWSGEQYVERTLALYRDPDLILVLRPPHNADEVRRLLANGGGRADANAVSGQASEVNLLHSYLVVESVVDPATCKLRLSPLTTATSIPEKAQRQQNADDDPRRRTCFELVAPSETFVFSAVVRAGDEETGAEAEGEAEGEGESGAESGGGGTDGAAYYETSAWEVAISRALFDVHRPVREALASAGNFETDQAWKHQVVLGTLHSHALSGDADAVRKALDIALRPKDGKELGREDRARILDGKDEFGLTALHYACARRLSAVVNLLVAAGADSTVPTLLRRKTPCHLSAEFLDERSLSTVLSASRPVRPDPNALDADGRTPMYVAAVEGKAVGGGPDPVALDRCLSALEAWGGRMMPAPAEGEGDGDDEGGRGGPAHPVHVAASLWRHAELEVLFSHCRYLFPLDVIVAGGGGNNPTVGALYGYPLHAALLSLRKKIAAAGRDGGGGGGGSREFEAVDGGESPLVSALRVLLDRGVEPNERMEGARFAGAAELNDVFGLTPLQVLAVAALEMKDLPDEGAGGSIGGGGGGGGGGGNTAPALSGIAKCVSEAAELLVKNGARTTIGAPPAARLKRSSSSLFLDDEERNLSLPPVDPSLLKIDTNMDVVECFGGDERMRSARVFWSSRKPVKAATTIEVQENAGKGGSFSSSDAGPGGGGNDSSSCAVCWDKFGKLRNRRHTCRVSTRYVCEACSTKRVVRGGKEHRVSDGQYLVAVVEADKRTGAGAQRKRDQRAERKKNLAAQAEAHRKRYNMYGAGSEASSGDRARGGAGEDDAAKEELFSGAAAVANTVKNFLMGEEEPEESAESQLQGVAATLNQTKDAFNERGERLNTLSEKTSALKDASRDFAKMAKELNRQQQNSWW